MTQGIEEQIGILPAVESEAHFFKISLQMLGAQFVPATTQTTLEQRESILDRVGVDISAHVIADSMLHGFMLETHSPCDARIHISFIGEQYFDILPEILAQEFLNRLGRDVLGVEQPKLAIALTDADYWTLFGAASTPIQSTTRAADVGFIHFDFPVEHWSLGLDHCSTDAVAQVPSRFVASDSERALNLASGYALLGLAEKHGSHEPFGEREMAIIEDRASGDSELVIAIFAVEQLLVSFKLYRVHLAARAARAFGPAQSDKQFAATIFGWKHGVNIN